jgi:hypothetical protein
MLLFGKAKSSLEIVSQTMAWFEDYTRANQIQHNTYVRNTVLTWSPPLPHTLKLNVDGAFLSSSNCGGLGVVVKNHNGQFLASFAKPVHHVISAYQIELLSIREALYFLSSFPNQQTTVVRMWSVVSHWRK